MNEHMPSLFIGSSTEGLDVAREVELQLQRDAITTIWKDGVFGLGSGTLESLMKVLEQFDFAVMVLSPDDLVESRNQSYASTFAGSWMVQNRAWRRGIGLFSLGEGQTAPPPLT
jgi:predicted nucleotide-binding protein